MALGEGGLRVEMAAGLVLTAVGFDATDRSTPTAEAGQRPSSELLTAVAATIDAERRCCRFFRFEVADDAQR